MSCSSCDPWGTNLRRSCFVCKDPDTSAKNGASTTLNTPSYKTVPPANATSAGMASGSFGIPSQSPYFDILADLLTILNGKSDLVDDTPMMKLAAQAIEYELADRILDDYERAHAK